MQDSQPCTTLFFKSFNHRETWTSLWTFKKSSKCPSWSYQLMLSTKYGKALPYPRAMLIFSVSFQFYWIFHVRALPYAKWTSPEFNEDTKGVIMLGSPIATCLRFQTSQSTKIQSFDKHPTKKCKSIWQLILKPLYMLDICFHDEQITTQ